MRFLLISVIIVMLAGGCNKKPEPAPESPPEETPVTPPPADTFTCGALPPVPLPFGWSDTTTDANKNITAFFKNPLNSEELILVVQGDAFGYNKMLNFNTRTRVQKQLAVLDQYLPSVNARGWIVYSTADNNLFKIKANGDSLTQLSNQNISHDPKWDASGNFIYFLQDAHNNVSAQLVKANTLGTAVISIPHADPLTAAFRKSDKVIMQIHTQGSVTLLLRNMSTSEEKQLITQAVTNTTTPHFNNLCLDHNDENFYWWNPAGIFRCNLSTLQTDTLFKSCENMIYERPLMSPVPGEMTFSLHTIRPMHIYRLLHTYQAMEFNLTLKELREIRLFN